MRLLKTSLITLLLLVLTGTALAANLHDQVTTTMRGTARIASGGAFQMSIGRKPQGTRFHVVIHYDVRVTSPTVVGFAVYPCRDTTCGSQSMGQIALDARGHHVTFTGRVPVVRAGRKACVFAQVRDLGPNGTKPGKIVHHGKLKGVTLCTTK
jgi:hypothetical protein